MNEDVVLWDFVSIDIAEPRKSYCIIFFFIIYYSNIYTIQEGYGADSNWKNLCDPEESQSRENQKSFTGSISHSPDLDEGGKVDGKPGLENRSGSNVLPFEFVALETCLEAACSCLENEVSINVF